MPNWLKATLVVVLAVLVVVVALQTLQMAANTEARKANQ